MEALTADSVAQPGDDATVHGAVDASCASAAAASAPAESRPLTCTGCGEGFPSRNALFRHVREHGCGGTGRRRVERHLLLYGYVGSRFHGSQMNAAEEEARCPTVEGALLSALDAAARIQLDVTSASVQVRSRASRTDRGVHALASALCVQTITEYAPQEGRSGTQASQVASSQTFDGALEEQHWLEAVRLHLPKELDLVRRFVVDDPEFNARFACQKREYWYYVPYDAILLPEERSVCLSAGSSQRKALEHAATAQSANSVWIMGLPDEFDLLALERRVLQLLAHAKGDLSIVQVAPCAESSGSATITFADAEAMLDACEALDGAAGLPDLSGISIPMLALPEVVASVWRSAHTRLRGVLKKLTGTRSFHNFSPGFADAMDPKSIRSVYRCRSGITSGYRELVSDRAFAVLRISGRDFLYKQIRGMVGLVVAAARGTVPQTYLDLALSDEGGIEVPYAPPGNLVLAECVFRDGAFAPPWAARSQATSSASVGCLGLPNTALGTGLRARIVDELCAAAPMRGFAAFVSELDHDTGPRMTEFIRARAGPAADCLEPGRRPN